MDAAPHANDASGLGDGIARLVLESAPDAILVVDAQGRIAYANAAASAMFGYAHGEIAALPVEALIPERFRERHAKDRSGYAKVPHARMMGTHLDFRARRKDGTEFSADISLTPIASPGGLAVAAVIRDISARRELELQLRTLNASLEKRVAERTRSLHEMTARYHALARLHELTLRAVPDLGARVDEAGRIVWVNRATETLLGLRQGQLMGRVLFDFIAPEDHARVIADVEAARLGRLRAPSVVTVLTPDRGPRRFAWTGAPLFDEESAFVGNVGVGRDITAELEAAQRQQDLLLEQAESQRLRAVEQERAKFFNLMAHEVNNPLTVLLLQVELLKEEVGGNLNEEQQRIVSRLDSNLARLHDLLKDLLDTARVQSGELRLRPARVDVSALLRDVVESHRSVAQKAGVALEIEAPERLVANADPRRLTQALVNLLTNALKFTPREGRIRVDATHDGENVTVRVQDTGIGIPPSLIGSLFEPFSQAHEESAAKGTGLGLYITRGILEAHGGRVGCESEGEGRGSTFWFTLPAPPGS